MLIFALGKRSCDVAPLWSRRVAAFPTTPFGTVWLSPGGSHMVHLPFLFVCLTCVLRLRKCREWMRINICAISLALNDSHRS
jgi:hypothetical protein